MSYQLMKPTSLSWNDGVLVPSEKVAVGLDWETAENFSGSVYSLAFLLGINQLLPSNSHLVFWNQTQGPDDCLVDLMTEAEMTEAEMTEAGAHTMNGELGIDSFEGWTEAEPWFLIDLSKIPEEVEAVEIVFVLDPEVYTFACFERFKVSLHEQASRSVIVEFDFLQHVSVSGCATMGRLQRDDESWYFRCVSDTHENLQSCVQSRLFFKSLN